MTNVTLDENTNLLLFFFGHGESYTLSQSKCWRLRLGQRKWLGRLDPLIEKSIQYMHDMYWNQLLKTIKIFTHVFLNILFTKSDFNSDSISWWGIDCIWCQWWGTKSEKKRDKNFFVVILPLGLPIFSLVQAERGIQTFPQCQILNSYSEVSCHTPNQTPQTWWQA